MAFAYSINNVKIGLTLTPRIYNPAANTNGCQHTNRCCLRKEKVIFTSLDYWTSPRFLPKPQNHLFGLLELAIPDILPP